MQKRRKPFKPLKGKRHVRLDPPKRREKTALRRYINDWED